MKRLLCFILIFLLLTPAALAKEEKMVFRLEEARGNVGDTVTMNGLVENAATCASFRLIFTYDKEVLQPVSVKKIDCGGIFMSNVNYIHEGKEAINVLSAHASKSFEGNVTLFSITFKILAESPETTGSPLTLVHQEFFDPSTPKPQAITPTVEIGAVYVGEDQPADTESGSGTDTNTGTSTDTNTGTNTDTGTSTDTNTGTSTDTNTGTNTGTNTDTNTGTNTGTNTDTNTDTNTGTDTNTDTNTGSDGEASSDAEDKKPTGSWIPDKDTDDLYHVDEEGNTTVFQPEFSETPEPGKVTDVILKDKETGKEVGSLKVEGKEDGTYDVIEQDVPSLNQPEEAPEGSDGETTGAASDVTPEPGVDPDGISIWVWIGIGGGLVLLAGGLAAWYFLFYRKQISKE